MTLTTTIRAGVSARLIGSSDFSNPRFDLPFPGEITLADGTAASKADVIFSDQRTISASSNEDLDLSGSLTDAIGGSAVFAKVKCIYIKAADANTNDVQVKPAASNGFTGPFADASDRIDIAPGGSLLISAPVSGWAVTAGTGDLLNVANSSSGTGVTYDIVVVGTSA